MKKLYILFFVILLLTSCGPEGEIPEDDVVGGSIVGENNKSGNASTSFIIETMFISDFNSESVLKKTGKTISSQNLDITSQATGKISKIYIKNGETIKLGQTIATIKDSYNKYYLDLDKAKIDLDKQIINKDSQLLSLEQKITDTKISLDDTRINFKNAEITAENDTKKAKIDFENTKTTTENERKQAELDLGNNNLIIENSQSKLELEKAELDYNNTLNSNKQKITGYIQNVKKDYNNLYISLVDIIRFSDELLGVTSENKDKSKIYKNYLGAKNNIIKIETKSNLRELITYKKDFLKLNINTISEENILEFMGSFYSGYGKINVLLENLEETLDSSITSIGSLSQTDIDNFISKINNYQSSNQGNFSSFTSTQNSISSFINTYKDSELSTLKNVELQKIKLENSSESSEISYAKIISSINNSISTSEINYNKTIVSIENTLNSSSTRLKQAEQAYDNAVKNRKINIRSLNNSIASAQNSKNKANAEYAKLTISSPINGVISSINIDENADVSNGTKLFTIISNNDTQIEVSFNSKDIANISIGGKVQVSYGDEILSGTVYSKSSVANNNLEYTVMVSLDENIDLIGGSTIVTFLGENSNVILPIDLVEIEGNNVGYLNYYIDGKSEKIEVQLGKINGNNVEILSELPEGIEIIVTDLKNYNQGEQTLVINNK